MTSKPRVRVTTDGRVRVNDTFTNVAAQLGTSRDKSRHSTYSYIPLQAFNLLTAYRSAWLARKIVDIPADDATRKWRSWQADEKIVSLLEKAEKLHRIQPKTKAAMTAARLFGGAALYISVRNQNPAEPLDLSKVKAGDLLGVDLYTRYQLTPDALETDDKSEWWGWPKGFRIAGRGATGGELVIHPSRLAIFRGEATITSDNLDWLWGDSVLQSTLDTVKHHDSMLGNCASLVFEANVDILHIPRLMEQMADPTGEGDQAVLKYLSLLAQVKGNNGMLVLDGGDTSLPDTGAGGVKYDRKSITFGGLADLWDRFMIAVSAAADIPVTRLFGRSAAGMNATGEGDRKNYNESIASMQSNEMQDALSSLDEVLIRSVTGNRDDALHYLWRPLDEPTEAEKAQAGKTTADTLKVVSDMQVFPVETMQAIVVAAMSEIGALPGFEAATAVPGALDLPDPEEGVDSDPSGALGGEAAPDGGQPRARGNARLRVVDAAPAPLYVRRDVVNKADIIRWAKAEGFEDVLDDLHVTIAYSTAPVDWMKVSDNWEEELTISAGGPRVLDQFGALEPVSVLRFNSRSLQWRHEEIKDAGASWDWPEYAPHITISRGAIPEGAQPYTGRIVLGPEIFEELRKDG